jgi:hypothetical protein
VIVAKISAIFFFFCFFNVFIYLVLIINFYFGGNPLWRLDEIVNCRGDEEGDVNSIIWLLVGKKTTD